MTWLAIGIVYGTGEPFVELINTIMSPIDEAVKEFIKLNTLFLRFFYLFVGCVFAIGGFVVVGQMLMSYGHCIQIGEASF